MIVYPTLLSDYKLIHGGVDVYKACILLTDSCVGQNTIAWF